MLAYVNVLSVCARSLFAPKCASCGLAITPVEVNIIDWMELTVHLVLHTCNVCVFCSQHVYLLQPEVWRCICVCVKTCFLPSHRCLMPPSWGMPCDIGTIYTLLKSTFSELQFRHWKYGSVFIRLAVIASETRESWNSKKIWPYSSSRSSSVIDLGVDGKPICDFLLVINCNFSHICYRFRDIRA